MTAGADDGRYDRTGTPGPQAGGAGATGGREGCPYWQPWHGCDRRDCALCEGAPGSEACRDMQKVLNEERAHPAGCCWGLSAERCECVAVGQAGCCASCVQGELLERCDPFGGLRAYFEAMLWQYEAAEGCEWN